MDADHWYCAGIACTVTSMGRFFDPYGITHMLSIFPNIPMHRYLYVPVGWLSKLAHGPHRVDTSFQQCHFYKQADSSWIWLSYGILIEPLLILYIQGSVRPAKRTWIWCEPISFLFTFLECIIWLSVCVRWYYAIYPPAWYSRTTISEWFSWLFYLPGGYLPLPKI